MSCPLPPHKVDNKLGCHLVRGGNIPDLDIYAHALIFDFTLAARGKRRADLQAFCEVPILH